MHIPFIKRRNVKKGFTLIELLVSIVIFMLMTTLLVAKYGDFNSGVLLTDAAYDVAIAVRQAQTFGVSVKGQDGQFDQPYGVHFSRSSSPDTCGSNVYTFHIFSIENKASGNLSCDNTSLLYTKYNFKKNIYISDICAGTSCGKFTADIVFVRPIPDPKMFTDNNIAVTDTIKVELKSSDGSTRNVIVRDNGQITIE